MKRELIIVNSLTLLESVLWPARNVYSKRLIGRGLLDSRVMPLLGFTLCGSYGKGSRASIRTKGKGLWRARRL